LAYVIEYSPEAEDHLRWLTTRQQRTVLDTVDRQLLDQPGLETRNRKPMRPNPVAPWELRIGNLRVYYEVKDEPEFIVTILAVGVKERDRILIGGEAIEL
jgi:mRNA-degrading endonuclease RelE of RelBE toxin-antitoxin system